MREACIYFYHSAQEEQSGTPPVRTIFKFYRDVNDLLYFCEGYSDGSRLRYYSIVFD